jgi:hypothetical protein
MHFNILHALRAKFYVHAFSLYNLHEYPILQFYGLFDF